MTSTNMRTREEWLHAILYSGEVTRIGQHLALVIYHLADPTTNTAKLSARDLERITGWSRTAIIDHLAEIEIFIRVTWGAGRAKSLFELQGVIAQVLATTREAASTPDATAAAASTTEVATTVSVQEPDTQAAAKAATKPCVNVAGHSSVSVADTSVQKPILGGTIGGENNNYPSQYKKSLSGFPAAPGPTWMIAEDGGFEGRVFELAGAEVAGLEQVYSNLDWPGDLVAADQYLANQFDAAKVTPPLGERMARLHTYLARRNREVIELRRSLKALQTDKPQRKPAQPLAPPIEPPSAWFDADAKLQVANGFKTELLEMFGNDEFILRQELDRAGGFVGVNVKGLALVAKVRSAIAVQQDMGGKSKKAAGLPDDSAAKAAWQRKVIEDVLREGSK